MLMMGLVRLVRENVLTNEILGRGVPLIGLFGGGACLPFFPDTTEDSLAAASAAASASAQASAAAAVMAICRWPQSHCRKCMPLELNESRHFRDICDHEGACAPFASAGSILSHWLGQNHSMSGAQNGHSCWSFYMT